MCLTRVKGNLVELCSSSLDVFGLLELNFCRFINVKKSVSERLHIWVRRSSKANGTDEMRHVTTCFMQNAAWKQLLQGNFSFIQVNWIIELLQDCRNLVDYHRGWLAVNHSLLLPFGNLWRWLLTWQVPVTVWFLKAGRAKSCCAKKRSIIVRKLGHLWWDQSICRSALWSQ